MSRDVDIAIAGAAETDVCALPGMPVARRGLPPGGRRADQRGAGRRRFFTAASTLVLSNQRH